MDQPVQSSRPSPKPESDPAMMIYTLENDSTTVVGNTQGHPPMDTRKKSLDQIDIQAT